MKYEFDPRHLPVMAFAREEASLEDKLPLKGYERLIQETNGQGASNEVHFEARGSLQADAAGRDEPWLHLSGQVLMPLVCQRCLAPVDIQVGFDRDFRFVASEALAEVEDEESEEDVLVLSKSFDLRALAEDEFLMAMPVVALHEVCPQPVKLQTADPDFVDEEIAKPNPFAVLAKLKK
jgi:uncharacterized protein